MSIFFDDFLGVLAGDLPETQAKIVADYASVQVLLAVQNCGVRILTRTGWRRIPSHASMTKTKGRTMICGSWIASLEWPKADDVCAVLLLDLLTGKVVTNHLPFRELVVIDEKVYGVEERIGERQAQDGQSVFWTAYKIVRELTIDQGVWRARTLRQRPRGHQQREPRAPERLGTATSCARRLAAVRRRIQKHTMGEGDIKHVRERKLVARLVARAPAHG
jgi:hypothetical protein